MTTLSDDDALPEVVAARPSRGPRERRQNTREQGARESASMASSSSRHQPRHAVGTYSTRSLPPELEESEEATAVWAAARAASSSTRLTLIDGWRIEGSFSPSLPDSISF